MKKLIMLGMIVMLALFVWQQRFGGPKILFKDMPPPPARQPAPDNQSVESSVAHNNFRCDGRKRCREMTSCEEARFFVQNCAGVEMDGDHDGLPCEDWCGHGQ